MLKSFILFAFIFSFQMVHADPMESAKQAVPGYIDPNDAKQAASVKVIYTVPNCNPFLDAKGVVGSYGKQVVRSIEKLPDVYFNRVPKDFVEGRKLCPNFKNMTPSQKRLFWVWTFRSLGHTESSCRAAPPVTIKTADRKNKNPSYHADRGMYQLNYARCGQINLNSAENSIDCTVKVLAKEIERRGRLTSRQIVKDDIYEITYWGPLRTDSENSQRSKGSIRNSKRTQETISRFKFCQAPTNNQDEEREEDKDHDELTDEVEYVKTKVIVPPKVEMIKQKDGTYKEKITPGKSEVTVIKRERVPKAEPVDEKKK